MVERLGVPEEDQAQRWRHGERHDHRCQQGQSVGGRQGSEECPRQPGEGEDRHDRDDLEQRRVDDGAAHLQRRVENDSRRRPGAARGAV